MYGQRFNGKFYDINGNVEHELKYGKGKGKEYNHDGKLIFEGDYLYGKKSIEKAKEYDRDGKIRFEGEYLNVEKHGKGKEYYLDDKIRFDGEYLNGETRKGKRYDYYDASELEYINKYLEGQLHQKVIEYDCLNGELFFESEYLNLNGKQLGKRR